jgi:hypothetical protein
LPAAASSGGEGGGGGWEGLEDGLGFVATRVAPERSDAGAERVSSNYSFMLKREIYQVAMYRLAHRLLNRD